MTHVIPEKLYQNLTASRFRFIKPGIYTVNRIYELVQGEWSELCDDDELCDHEDHIHRPEWKHKVRLALEYFKSPAGNVRHQSYNTWIIGAYRIERTVQLDLDSIKTEEEFIEGEKREQWSYHYERNPELRAAAILHHGTTCMACNFNFKSFYGERGEGFIEVHHLHPVSTLDNRTKINPITDMVVLCSNCHRMIHRRSPILTVGELSRIFSS